MDKLIMLVFLFFATNLDVAYPIIWKKLSKQFETDFKGTGDRRYKLDSIPEKCEEIKKCKRYYKIFKVCTKIEKCTQ